MSKKQFKLINVYEQDEMKQFLKKSHNPNYDTHHIDLPFRMLIIGSSGSGKTMTLINLLRAFSGTFQNINIITKNADEPLYNFVADKFKKINDDFNNPASKSKKKHNFNVEISEGLNTLPKLDSYDKNEQSLVILDDLVLEKNQKPIEEYFIRCRKQNVSIIYISQSYFAIPNMIRNNVNYMIIKQVSSKRNLKLIANEYSLDLDSKELKKLYDFCTDKLENFLFIDIDHKNMRFRKNLSFVIDIESLKSI
jgi:ABC-type dipeptide/oligopeptide/nickel transport system ATPase component